MIYPIHSFEKYAEELKESYKEEFGLRKFNKVVDVVNNSRKIDKLMGLSLAKRAIPDHMDFVDTLHAIPFFMFSVKVSTKALGGILAIERWNEECNKRLNLTDDFDVGQLAIEFLTRINSMGWNDV